MHGPVSDGSVIDGRAPDSGGLASCLDHPNNLPGPPPGRLPCELIPPGFQTDQRLTNDYCCRREERGLDVKGRVAAVPLGLEDVHAIL